jgi:hypothetical protein
MLLRFDLSVAIRCSPFSLVGIELGRASREGGGLPSSPFRSARRVHNSTSAAFPEAPYGQNSHRARCPTHEPHFKHSS